MKACVQFCVSSLSQRYYLTLFQSNFGFSVLELVIPILEVLVLDLFPQEG
jgi:hypothetical protein